MITNLEYFQKSNLRPSLMNNFDLDLPTLIDFECLHLTIEYGLDKNNGTMSLIDLNQFEWTNLDLHPNVFLLTQYMRIMHRSLLSADVEDLTLSTYLLHDITSRYEWVLDDQDPETFRIATEPNYTALATYLRRLANAVYNLLDDYRGYLDYTETGYDRTFLISTETSAEL